MFAKERNSPKIARLEARITADQRSLIERAAAYEGRTTTDFVVHALQQVARSVIQAHEVLRLDAAQSRAAVELLLAPPQPNKALRQAAKDYRQRIISQ